MTIDLHSGPDAGHVADGTDLHSGPDAGHAVEGTDRVAIRVWQIPVRVIHWTLVASIVVLSLTGGYIANPALLPVSGIELMAYVRAVHLGVGFVFIACLVCRVIFAFTGNRYARWHQFIPMDKAYRGQIVPSFLFYTFRRREPPSVIGHNPLAGMTYLVLFGMFAVQAVTGIALDAVDGRAGWEWSATGWILQLVPLATVRLAHHVIMWMTWGFVIHHVYSSILMDHLEHCGLVSSIITGWKSIPKDRD